jgi:hypothetical protein
MRECIHLFYIKIKNILNKKNLIFYFLLWLPISKQLKNGNTCMSSFMSIYFINYIYVQEKFNIMKNKKIREYLLIQI